MRPQHEPGVAGEPELEAVSVDSAIERRLMASIVARRAITAEARIAKHSAEQALFGVGQALTLGRWLRESCWNHRRES
jgi:hypothetical protein